MKRILFALSLLSVAGTAAAQTPPPTSALDGDWRGRSDGGSCNAPLDYVITIENGFVDGSAYDTVLYVKQQDCSNADFACDDDGGAGTQSLVSLTAVPAGNYFIMVDGFSSNTGAYTLTITGTIGSGEACDMAQITAGIVSCAAATTCTSGICQ